MRLKTLKGQVEYCLSNYKGTRDNDIVLMIRIWKDFYSDYIKDDKINLSALYELPREDNIKRIRANLQNVEKKYLPNSLEIALKRGIREEDWREFLGYSGKMLF